MQDLLLSGNEAVLGGEKREITTLFSDIAGFTTLSESMDPDQLVRLLGEYFERMSEAFRRPGWIECHPSRSPRSSSRPKRLSLQTLR